MTQTSKLQVVLPSEVRQVDLVHSISDRVAAAVGMDDDQTLNLGLAVREATINAIKHGNGLNSRKKVTVTFEFDRREVTVSVRDSGSGFDPHAAPDPTLPENLGMTNGRGFLLMRAFVDRVEVVPQRRGGSLVRLVKTVQPSSNGRDQG